jgi:DNA-binding MarR family transcriptional regulator
MKLSGNEVVVLYQLCRWPLLTDREHAERAGMSPSTFSSIRGRLERRGYFKRVRVPMMQDLGCEMLVVIYTEFNPAIPLEKRVEATRKSIEIHEELIYSVGETNKGFSLSLAGDYTAASRIADVRTGLFASMNLLERSFPEEVVFPFSISRIDRFMEFAPLLASSFGIKTGFETEGVDGVFRPRGKVSLSETERIVYTGLIEHPEMNDTQLGEILPVGRHTISKIRNKMENSGLIKTLVIPDLKMLGFKVICFYRIRYLPKKPIDIHGSEPLPIMDNNTFFIASRKYDTIMLSAYMDYDEAKMENMRKVQFLKENGFIEGMPVIQEYSVTNLVIIKDLTFGPITRKILLQG